MPVHLTYPRRTEAALGFQSYCSSRCRKARYRSNGMQGRLLLNSTETLCPFRNPRQSSSFQQVAFAKSLEYLLNA